MKKLILLALIPYNIFAQIGINTATPSATLELTAKAPTGTTTAVDGILIPRVDRQRAQSMATTPTSTLIYVNNIATGTQTGTAANIDTIGFYTYNGTAWVKLDSSIYISDGSLTGTRNVNLAGNNLGFTGTGNVGIGIAAPTAKLELASGTANTSGLKFTNMTSTSPTTQNVAALGVDTAGNVVIQNTVPLTSTFKSFSINATAPTASLITIGTLEFRFPLTTCTGTTDSYIQVRSTSGANNLGILHGMVRTAQDISTFVNTIPLTTTPTFANITSLPLNCVQDGHAQFNFYSYTDRTFYRVNINIADGDSLGFGALGYIFAELQR
ncbi:hypothetical protein M2347_001200 [Chryseobacterium sp. H1D6B]|uniref:hypothetical protein n=1 Tax=Chryseobacterium sp. H1D6B TaxID=2940588 RepID=UPI0015C9E0BE|nr:hypothetical protein [Chryseobacterium sp. H1D6B]MDH6251473.1 hypothetical protein [Chryseobacterium sp. H1D6B]